MIRNQILKKATKQAENSVLRVFMAIVLNFLQLEGWGDDAVDAPPIPFVCCDQRYLQ